VSGILNWWDGVELWLSGLGFVAQTSLEEGLKKTIAWFEEHAGKDARLNYDPSAVRTA